MGGPPPTKPGVQTLRRRDGCSPVVADNFAGFPVLAHPLVLSNKRQPSEIQASGQLDRGTEGVRAP